MQDIQAVVDLINPKQVGRYWFSGQSPIPQGRIFGGQVVAQCLLAANQTVPEELVAHSMHAYFLRAGNPQEPIEFEVDPIRNGRSFATRRVVARQNEQAIFNTSVSYQIVEGGISHGEEMPEVAAPETIQPSNSSSSQENEKYNLLDLFQIERRQITAFSDAPQPPHQINWFRTRGQLGNDPRLHQAVLAMITDFSLLGTGFLPHRVGDWRKEFMFASLDHAIWFHAPVDINKFILYQCDSPWAGNARGFNRGSIWSEQGTLLASVTQEGLMRKKRPRSQSS